MSIKPRYLSNRWNVIRTDDFEGGRFRLASADDMRGYTRGLSLFGDDDREVCRLDADAWKIPLLRMNSIRLISPIDTDQDSLLALLGAHRQLWVHRRRTLVDVVGGWPALRAGPLGLREEALRQAYRHRIQVLMPATEADVSGMLYETEWLRGEWLMVNGIHLPIFCDMCQDKGSTPPRPGVGASWLPADEAATIKWCLEEILRGGQTLPDEAFGIHKDRFSRVAASYKTYLRLLREMVALDKSAHNPMEDFY